MSPVLLMLISGFFYSTIAINRLRSFSLSKGKNWIEAKAYCETMNQSLVTIYDQHDVTIVQNLINDLNDEDLYSVWLGLSPRNVSTWSDGSPVTFNLSTVDVTHGEQRCEAVNINETQSRKCSDRKSFMCQSRTNYYLIENKMNWCQARDYCRKHFESDLASISNETQYEEVIIKGKNQTFWIGLMHDEWKWEDEGCSTYREWNEDEQWQEDNKCVQLLEQKLYTQVCDNEYGALCSTGYVRIKVIQKSLTWEEAFDYCRDHHSRLLQIENEQDQESVEQWLKNMKGTFWIGLRQSRVFGFWIWADKPVAYNNWKDGTIPKMPMSDNCGVLRTDDYRWSDEHCLYPHRFLCEEEISYLT